jgi:hypothetical protein
MLRLKKKDVRKKRHNDKKELQREIERELTREISGRQYTIVNDESYDNKFIS